MKEKSVCLFMLIGFILFTVSGAFSLEPPKNGEIQKLKELGVYDERLEFAEKIGNHKVDPVLVQRSMYRLKGISPAPPEAWRGLPTKGNVKVLAVLIDFSDTPHVNTANTINSKLFESGVSSEYPRESLANYYKRSSYNQLAISGSTMNWYTTTFPRSSVPQTDQGRENLIMEVLNYWNTQGHDFTQYDNDGDGDIDYLLVFWSGADNGWANFWWAYQTSWQYNTSYRVDGKSLSLYSWQWESESGGAFDPSVAIHETGHALGLPDYYDYNDNVGPDGGVGGLDMMDGNIGDHNCFSKWLLEWITPSVVSSGSQTKTIRSAGTYQDAVIVMPQASSSDPFKEYFMVQNRYRTGNDNDSESWMHSDGVLIWHVDARLDNYGYDYQYDNSYTDHKLLRLMEADGQEDIERNYYAEAADYYTSGKSFGPSTYPSSKKYDGTDSGASVTDFSATASSMTVLCSVGGSTTYSVSGTVRSGSSTGSVLSGATVSIAGKTATTSSSGTFTISGISSGTYTVQISRTGYQTYSGSLTVNGNVSGLVFSLVSGTTYSVSGTVRSGSSTGSVLSGATVSIAGKTATTSSSGTFTISGISSGTYTVQISKTGYQTYSGSLTVSANLAGLTFFMTAESSDDYGNNWNTATVIVPNSLTQGNIETAGDYDYFRIKLPATCNLKVYTTGTTDTYGYLKSSNQTIIAESDDYGNDTNFFIQTNVQPGTYYIAVRHYSLNRTGVYTLGVSITDDHGNDYASATAFTLNSTLSCSLEYPGDVDYFRVQLDQTGRIDAFTSGNTDTYLSLICPDGSVYSIDDWYDFNAYLLIYPLPAGTYYVAVRHYDSSSGGGAYDLTVSFTANYTDDKADLSRYGSTDLKTNSRKK